MGNYSFYSCLTCADGIKYSNKPDLKKHLSEKHGYKEGDTATRTMTVHLDGSGWHETWYEWDFATFKVQEETGYNRGRLKACSVCGEKSANFLCDYPITEEGNITCDKPLCSKCRVVIGPDKDYCPSHPASLKIQFGSHRREANVN